MLWWSRERATSNKTIEDKLEELRERVRELERACFVHVPVYNLDMTNAEEVWRTLGISTKRLETVPVRDLFEESMIDGLGFGVTFVNGNRELYLTEPDPDRPGYVRRWKPSE